MKRSRRLLAGLSLFAALSVMPAFGAEFQFTYGGQAHLSGYLIDQTELPTDDLNNFGFAGEGRGWVRVNWIADDGMQYGARAQLRAQSSEAEYSNDLIRGAPDFVDEIYAYVEFAFGRVTLGLDDGAADSAGIYSPAVSDINRIDDPRHYPVQDPTQSSFTAFSPNGAHPRTDLNASGDALKVTYYTPFIIGIQLSASYTPELTRGFDFGDDDRDAQGNIWEVGLKYQGALSGFDVGFYAGYVAGYNERETVGLVLPVTVARLSDGALTTFPSAPFTPDDLEEWGAGAQVAYEGFKIGGSYRLTNIAGGAGLADQAFAPSFSTGCSQIAGCVLPDQKTEIWSAGITYETGPWRFGAGYVTLEEELPLFLDTSVGPPPGTPRNLTQDAEGWTGAVGYEWDENLQFVVGYQRYDYDGPTGGCVAIACDTLEADLAYFQTSLTF